MARILSRRPLSEREARDRLERAGVAADEVDTALAHARDARWVDDSTFSRMWIEDRLARHPLSRRGIAEELRGRKVPRDVATVALDEHYPAEHEQEVALRLARQRLARLSGIDEVVRQRRTIDFLIRRGFAAALAVDAARRAVQGERHD